jgi:hypothetical protein
MIKIFYFSISILLCSCNQISDSKVTKNNVIEKHNLSDSLGETLFNYIFKKGLKGNQLSQIQPKPNIEFSSGETGLVSFYKYEFEYNDVKYKLIARHQAIADRSVYLNKVKAKIIRNDKNFNIDSLNLNIDYTESDMYAFKNHPEYLLIVSKPMNWTGTMTNYSFFQLISLKQNDVMEFINQDE